MKVFLEKDSRGNWNTIPPVPEDKLGNVNCHRFVLYTLGKITWNQMVSDAKAQKETGEDFIFGKAALEISDGEFTSIEDLDHLIQYMNQNCEVGKSYVSQILDVETKELAHSFIIQKINKNEYLCFDKPGFKYPFDVYGLEDIYEFVNKDGEHPYKNQGWRLIPIDNFQSF